jgi:hypothetical protein
MPDLPQRTIFFKINILRKETNIGSRSAVDAAPPNAALQRLFFEHPCQKPNF